LFGLLGTKSGFAQGPIKDAREERIARQSGHGAATHPVLSSAWMLGRMHHGTSRYLGLIDRPHRLSSLGLPGHYPRHCWGIYRRHLQHGHMHLPFLVQQFGAYGFVNAMDRALGPAISAL